LELTEVLLILGVFLPCFFVGIWQLNRLNPGKNPQKRAKNAADTSVSELFEVQTDQVKEILSGKNKQIKSLQQQLRQDQEEIEPEATGKTATFEEIQKLVHTTYPKYDKILPLFKKQIMESVKGMSITEIVQYITTITGKTGESILSEGSTTQNPQNNASNWA